MTSSSPLLDTIGQTIFDKKGENILALDIQQLSGLTDAVVIAEGSSERHVIALADILLYELKKLKLEPIQIEGLQTGDWVVLDYGALMIHLMTPAMREHYNLEELWRAGEIISIHIQVEPTAKGSKK